MRLVGGKLERCNLVALLNPILTVCLVFFLQKMFAVGGAETVFLSNEYGGIRRLVQHITNMS